MALARQCFIRWARWSSLGVALTWKLPSPCNLSKHCVLRQRWAGFIFHASLVRVVWLCSELAEQFAVQPRSVSVAEGESARFVCSIQGRPRPTISWMKDATVLSGNSSRYHYLLSRLTAVDRDERDIQVCCGLSLDCFAQLRLYESNRIYK